MAHEVVCWHDGEKASTNRRQLDATPNGFREVKYMLERAAVDHQRKPSG
jgi:hypothetical protein